MPTTCQACQRPIDDNVMACPHCGYRVCHTPSLRRADRQAVTGLTLGVASIFLPVPGLDILMAIAGTWLGIKTMNHPHITRHKTALAALWVGVMALCVNVFFWLVVLAPVLFT